MKKLVISRHKAFVKLCLDKKLVKAGEFEVISHISNPDMLDNRDIITSGLPLNLAARCNSITTIILNLPVNLRGKELTIDTMIRYLGSIETFKVEKL